eukprot:GSA120T00010563001.1
MKTTGRESETNGIKAPTSHTVVSVTRHSSSISSRGSNDDYASMFFRASMLFRSSVVSPIDYFQQRFYFYIFFRDF